MIMNWQMLEKLIMVVIAVLLGIILFTNYKSQIALKKDEWDCVKAAADTPLPPIQVGKTVVLYPVPPEFCVEYQRHQPVSRPVHK
jgi:hypothetical protein